jgi:ATP-dependent phosphofructokinase / diphosphate-dependent phosphofructokinase
VSETVAILVGGGPAPGINGVIASATIEAIHNGLRVIGLYDGYAHIAQGDTKHTVELDIDRVSPIHATGGSVLRTSRTNPGKSETTLRNCVRALNELSVRYLIAIGGDDTTYGATRIAEMTEGRIGVVTVPKTIDNDLPLPDNAPTFGFETARSVGTGIVENLMVDANTAQRWYLVVSMGRKSGALALGICKAAGADVAVIPEEFGEGEFDLDAAVRTISGAIIKRRAAGHHHGVAIVAEGIAERLSEEQIASLGNFARDAYGNIRLADVPIGVLLRDAIVRDLNEVGIEAPIVPTNIGYELRCAKPVPFDVEYTRTLGYGAVQYLLGGGSGALIALSGGRVLPIQLADLQDPATGRVRIRSVDVTTESYRVARSYMTRLEQKDFQEPQRSRLAAQTNLSAREFEERFGDVA